MTCIRNFLIRIKIGGFHTVCTYEKSDTLIHRYGISLIQVQQAYDRSSRRLLLRTDVSLSENSYTPYV